jgi:diguanylate cyclase (GGDEF)-like protein/PAS domain S-box-containing protein
MHVPQTESRGRSSLPIIGLCLLVICFRLGSSLLANHFYGSANREVETMLIQQSLIQQMERLVQVEAGMIGTGTVPDVPLDPLLAGTSDAISTLATRMPADAGRVQPLFDTFTSDLRAETSLVAAGQFDAAFTLRQSGSLTSGPALMSQLDSQYEASVERKSTAMRNARIALIVPTALGTVVVCVVLFIYDRRRRRAYALLARQDDRFRSLIQQSTDIILVTDTRGVITYATPAAVHAFGKSANELTGAPVASFVVPDDQVTFQDLIVESTSADGLPVRGEARFLLHKRIPRTMDIAAVNLIDKDAAQGIVITAHDITDRKMLLESLHYQAHHDNLTGLPNRLVLTERLQVALTRVRITGSPLSVLFVDLDDFKQINDRYGHAAGDERLIAVADTLRGALRIDDTVTRIGGDEFVILLENTDRNYAVRVAERIAEALAEVPTDGQTSAQRASIGIFVTREGNASVDLVLKHADGAMYAAKATGTTGWQVFGEPAPRVASVASVA